MAASVETLQGRNGALKRDIISHCIHNGDFSIPDLGAELEVSIPTATKCVSELMDAGLLEDLGKAGTSGGRKPSLYGLNPSAGYFVGTEVHRETITIAVTNFKGQVVQVFHDVKFVLDNSESRYQDMCQIIGRCLTEAEINRDEVMAYCFGFTGRVNHSTGYSMSYFIDENRPISEVLEQMLQGPVFIENDSRAMTYGEYTNGIIQDEKNIVFINASWGLGMGLILDGKLYYGQSGFSGEIGHFPMLSNGHICQCGKTGCLETGASGMALSRIVKEKLDSGMASTLRAKYNKKEPPSLGDIMEALKNEDVLAIEAIEEVGSNLGKGLAGVINIFNPQLVVVGGLLSEAKDYLLLPMMTAINKYSLRMVCKETEIKFSRLGSKCGAIGACSLARTRLLGLE